MAGTAEGKKTVSFEICEQLSGESGRFAAPDVILVGVGDGNIISGVVRDAVTELVENAVTGYSVVFVIEILFLLVSLFILQRVDVGLFHHQAERQVPLVERAAASEV